MQREKQQIACILWCSDRVFRYGLASRLASAKSTGSDIRLLNCVDFSAYDETPMFLRGGSLDVSTVGGGSGALAVPTFHGTMALASAGKPLMSGSERSKLFCIASGYAFAVAYKHP
eukprot:8751500-Pyramimonas_sp.AAC.1